MLSMRTLLSEDPLLAPEVRELILRDAREAHEHLVRLGANECEAAELLDLRPFECECE
jgi:hypothetical protein